MSHRRLITRSPDARIRHGTVANDKTRAMDVASALGTYLEIVDSTAPGLIEGLYVVGSFRAR